MTIDRSASAWRALLFGALLALSPACGLFRKVEPIGFRDYVLPDIGYDEAVSIVRDVTRRRSVDLFGGVGLTWDAATGNLTLDPVIDGNRRLRLFIHVAPAGADVRVEMFALVEHLESGPDGIAWVRPMQDVPLESQLYDAFAAEVLRRREAVR